MVRLRLFRSYDCGERFPAIQGAFMDEVEAQEAGKGAMFSIVGGFEVRKEVQKKFSNLELKIG